MRRLSLALCACLLLSSVAIASGPDDDIESTRKVLTYFFSVVDSDELYRGVVARQAAEEPAIAHLINDAASRFSKQALIDKLSPGYLDYLSQDELAVCLAFIHSSLGQEFEAATKTSAFKADPGVYFDALAFDDRRQVVAYMASNCSLTNSAYRDPAKRIYDEYVESLFCDAAEAKDPVAFSKLVAAGKCP